MMEWAFWHTLAALLWVGHLFRVGLFLLQFCLAAVVAGLAAMAFPLHLEEQLQIFLGAALVLLFALRMRYRKMKRQEPAREG